MPGSALRNSWRRIELWANRCGGLVLQRCGKSLWDENMKSSRAFTLIELLVAISIMALLIMLLVPTLRRAQELGNRAVCSSSQRKIATAILVYAEENNGRGPAQRPGYWQRGGSEQGLPRWHWILGPYLGVEYWDPEADGGFHPGMRYSADWEDREEQMWENQKAIFYKWYGCPSWQGQRGNENTHATLYRNQSLGVNQHILERNLSECDPPSEWLITLDNWVSYLDTHGGSDSSAPSVMRELAYHWRVRDGRLLLFSRHWREGLNLTMLDGHSRFAPFKTTSPDWIGEDIPGHFTGGYWRAF